MGAKRRRLLAKTSDDDVAATPGLCGGALPASVKWGKARPRIGADRGRAVVGEPTTSEERQCRQSDILFQPRSFVVGSRHRADEPRRCARVTRRPVRGDNGPRRTRRDGNVCGHAATRLTKKYGAALFSKTCKERTSLGLTFAQTATPGLFNRGRVADSAMARLKHHRRPAHHHRTNRGIRAAPQNIRKLSHSLERRRGSCADSSQRRW